MPPRKTSRKKVVATGTVVRKRARGKVGKAPEVITFSETRRFLNKMDKWWAQLGGDVAAVEEMLRQLPAGQPMSSAAENKFRRMVKKIAQDRERFFPIQPDHQICCD
jgi:hypothetical protein